MLPALHGVEHDARRQELGEHLHGSVRPVEEVERHAGAAEAGEDVRDGGIAVRPVAHEERDVSVPEGGLHFVAVKSRDLVGLTGDAPGGGEVDEDGAAFGKEGPDGLFGPRLPDAPALCGGGAVEFARGDDGDCAGRKKGRDAHQDAVATAAPLLSAEQPERDGGGAAARKHQKHAVEADLLGEHPAEPDDGKRHRNRHDLAEDVHPGPRPREHSRPAGEDAEQKPRKRHAQTEREEDGDRLDGGLRHGVAQSGAHEGGRAGAGDDDGEDAREERARGTGSRRAARNAGVGEMACGSEFKDAKQVDRDGDEEHEQERDDPRTLELEAPTERHAHAPEGEKRTRQHTHRDEDAAREGDAVRQQSFASAVALDELQDLEREDREDAGHQVEDEAAEEREDDGGEG